MKSKFSRFLSLLLTMLMMLTVTPVISAETVSGTDRGTPTGAPAAPMLSHNAWNGDPSYTVTFNIWWGSNATSYKLYENGDVILSGSLEGNSPNAQSKSFDFSGKAKGTYKYEIALTNSFGTTTATTSLNVTNGSEPDVTVTEPSVTVPTDPVTPPVPETETVCAPVFSPAPGTYTGTQNVTISCDTAGASIRYTTDGSTPTTSSALYSGAIEVSASCTIKAQAFKSGMNDSSVASAAFTIRSESSGTVTVEEWEPLIKYALGDLVSYKGSYYECTYAHTSLDGWQPDSAPTLWKVFTGELPIEPEDPSSVKVTDVTLDKTSLTIEKGKEAVLTATVLPDNATNKAVTWTSSDKSVATVTNGKIIAVAKGTATITAKAGSKTAVCNVTVVEAKPEAMPADSPIQGRVLTGYWQNFDNGATCLKLGDVPVEYDIICISFADSTRTAGEIEFNLDPDLCKKLNGYTVEEFKADVKKAHSKGQKVVLAIGGEKGNVIINSPASAKAFADSAYALMQEYGFDGVDVDLEHGIDVNNLADSLHLLADKAGKDFILTMAPQTLDVYTYDATYLKLARATKDILTIMNTQYYNSGGMPGYGGANYNQGTIGFLNSLATTQLESGLRPDQIGIGLPATPQGAGGGYQDPANVAAALESLVYGTEAGGFTPPKAYNNLRGAMTWSINWDATSGYKFAKTMASCYAKLPPMETTGESGPIVTTTEPVITTTEAVTTTQATEPEVTETSATETSPIVTETEATSVTEITEATSEPEVTSVTEITEVTTVTETTTVPSGDKTEPPYPFWKNYQNYAQANTRVYYQGKIYYNKWYANAGVKPDSGDPWVLEGNAEWTVPEDAKNYEKDENATSNEINKILTDAEINTLYGGINPNYSPESALGRLEELIPKSSYEELFPYRFGSEGWKNSEATKMYYPDPSALPDYYSYENLQEAVHTLANTIIKVQWYEGAEWCYRLIRLDKTTKEQKLIYSDTSFEEDWLVNGKTLCTSICDYGSFLAVGDLNTRKRELAGFLANISHETGGGSVDGTIDESLTGLYFNEEVGFIGSSAIGYVQGSGTSYLPVAGKSYHGRGPIQLSYNYNYGLCSDVLYGDSSVLLNDPDKVEQDGVLGFMTGIWFWMTPQPPKPSCHQVITGIWEPKAGGANADYNGNFGLTIIIINNEAGQSETGTGAVARRARYYRIFAEKMGADITNEHCDTVGMTTFVAQNT